MHKDRRIIWKLVPDPTTICDWIQGPHKCIEPRGHNFPTFHACACGHTFTYENGISIVWVLDRIAKGKSIMNNGPDLKSA